MAQKGDCSVCTYEAEHGIKVDTSTSKTAWEKVTGLSRHSIKRHLEHPPRDESAETDSDTGDEWGLNPNGERYIIKRGSAVTMKDWREWISADGDDPDDFIPSIRSIAYGGDLYSNRLGATPKRKGTGGEPAWPVIQPAAPVTIAPSPVSARRLKVGGDYRVALKCADPQIGFRHLPDGSYDPFHDQSAMSIFVETCREYQPDKITILGDFLDLPSQGRFDQEAAFANTTQLAINAGHVFLAQLREAAPEAEIILIEGNHDLRMRRFIESNALAAFGIKRAEMPDSWPVMSLPFLLRLDDLNVKYVDAYPAATDWDNDLTRNIHGTKANSKGSTMAQYVHELPHVSTWAGHTHRCEIVYRTVLGARGEPIESYAANPGVLCRVDGAVPSVHGATGSSGIPERIVEDWQQGFGILYYNETESWPQVVRIRNGRAVIEGQLIAA